MSVEAAVEWILKDPASLLLVPVSAVGIYAVIVVATRLAGLRSFSKMSSFDFAITVAMGSIMAATVVAPTPSLAQGGLGLLSLFLIQYLVTRLRVSRSGARQLFDNEPLLLMDAEGVRRENMRAAGVTRADLLAKLREANVLNLSQVRAVVMETTGDVSVLHARDDDEDFDAVTLLDGVRR